MSLADYLGYDPETGAFWWKRQRGKMRAGDAAGHIQNFQGRCEYRMIRFGGRLYFAHQVACAIRTGALPEGMVDHKDGNSLNDRWTNLRPASRSQNQQNRGRPKHNKSGAKGVSWCKDTGRWVARIREPGGRYRNLGRYDTVAAAKAQYDAAAKRLFGEFARV